MAALVEGHQYGLSSHELLTQNKSVVHVKLTDSALKTIEEFVKSKVSKIQFVIEACTMIIMWRIEWETC